MFLDKRTKVFTWLGESQLRKGLTMIPTLLKILSEGTLIPGSYAEIFLSHFSKQWKYTTMFLPPLEGTMI